MIVGGAAPKQARSATRLLVRLPAGSAPDLVPLSGSPKVTGPATPPLTLLDEVGSLNRPVPLAQADSWLRELASRATSLRASMLQIWIGEWQLAGNQQPENAYEHFGHAQAYASAAVSGRAERQQCKALYGLAAYDRAISVYKEGAYVQAAADFKYLLNSRTAMPGYPRQNCAFWYRHASICAGYHAQRSAMGIPEPPRLDPQCAAAALASCLCAQSLPYDRKTVLAACRVTGEGSNLHDVLVAAQKLHVDTHTLFADDAGLIGLPKPLIAYVEHDHYISLIGADSHGVSYLCSDCGAWPGGRVSLTWAQWHALEPSFYVAVSRPGTTEDRNFDELPRSGNPGTFFTSNASAGVALRDAAQSPIRLSYVGSLSELHLSLRMSIHSGWQLARSHSVLSKIPQPGGCGNTQNSNQCDCPICCLMDGGGFGGGGFGGGGFSPGNPGGSFTAGALFGASAGDPVNAATGEEEYSPEKDLTVYNPHGPSVAWGRIYDSLRPQSLPYESCDFGPGWSQPYNIGVYDPSLVAPTPVQSSTVPQNGEASFVATGTAQPQQMTNEPNPPTWDIVGPAGTVVANSLVPQGWIVTFVITSQGGQNGLKLFSGALVYRVH